jgi:hypothetical protein
MEARLLSRSGAVNSECYIVRGWPLHGLWVVAACFGVKLIGGRLEKVV